MAGEKKNYILSVLEGLESKCQQGQALSEGPSEKSITDIV